MKESANDIIINVETNYLAEQSLPDENRFAFSYTITIHNSGDRVAKLTHRHWLITDANGKTEEVHGEGVIGQQPKIAPGESFSYTSGTVIDTPVGAMQGSYDMTAEEGITFSAPIEPFGLHVPGTLN